MFWRFFSTVLCCCVIFLAVPNRVFAISDQQHIVIRCTQKGACESSTSDAPFFTADNMVPGESVSRIVSIHNQRKDEGCELGVRARHSGSYSESDLSDELTLSVTSKDTPLTAFPLRKLLTTETPLYIDTLNAATMREYSWNVLFNKSAGNEYQGSTATVDFDLSFSCDESIKEPAPLPSPKPSQNPGAPTPQTCSNTPPKGTLNLTSIPNPNNLTTTKLRWNSLPNATNYQLTFGTTDGELLYPAIDVGNTTEYSPQGLSPQKNYFFSITARSGCAIGATSKQVILERKKVPPTPKENQNHGNLSNTEEVIGQKNEGKVLGAQTEVDSSVDNPTQKANNRFMLRTFYIHFCFILLLVLFIFFIIKRRRKKTPIRRQMI